MDKTDRAAITSFVLHRVLEAQAVGLSVKNSSDAISVLRWQDRGKLIVASRHCSCGYLGRQMS